MRRLPIQRPADSGIRRKIADANRGTLGEALPCPARRARIMVIHAPLRFELIGDAVRPVLATAAPETNDSGAGFGAVFLEQPGGLVLSGSLVGNRDSYDD